MVVFIANKPSRPAGNLSHVEPECRGHDGCVPRGNAVVWGPWVVVAALPGKRHVSERTTTTLLVQKLAPEGWQPLTRL